MRRLMVPAGGPVLGLVLGLTLGLVLGLAACGGSDDAAAPAPTTAAAPAASTTPSSAAAIPTPALGATLAENLTVPWGVAFLDDGSALMAERPTGDVVRVSAGGGTTAVGTVPGVADQGEGGLLGLAYRDGTLFAYLTSTAGDNRVVALPYRDGKLGTPRVVVQGIASAYNHNGGLLRIGPDGKLWIGTGDAAQSDRAQNRASLNGKILRVDLDGSVPADNPFPGSPVYSLGHRNVQGLDFDDSGQPWAVEFGQDTWDELNRIRPGANYGWPIVEGKEAHAGFTEPLVQWATDDASPSGLAVVDDVAYVGGLKGERLWQVPLHGTTVGQPRAWFRGRLGRIRTVVAAPGGGLWITTSNTDGRGDPKDGDDRIVAVELS
jgi:glucose/arabinose dehydrogenase